MNLTEPWDPRESRRDILENLDQKKSVEDTEYKQKLHERQLQLLGLQHRLAKSERSLVVVFEGPDAAGKGGAIKRIVGKLDPRTIRVYSTVKPTPDQAHHHYLWRFWVKLPPAGVTAVFDRSWYGRLLVERVENFATKEEWKRAYREINEFEQTLADNGAILLKFYLHITKDEQLARFKKREADPAKAWKINDEDWRNREKWDEHNAAAEEMFARTSSIHAPWHVIAANYKWRTRLKVLKVLCDRLETDV